MLKRVVLLEGDVSQDEFGLSAEHLKMVIEETDIVFHCAATLRLEAKLKDAIEMNTVKQSEPVLARSRAKDTRSHADISLGGLLFIATLFSEM